MFEVVLAALSLARGRERRRRGRGRRKGGVQGEEIPMTSTKVIVIPEARYNAIEPRYKNPI